MNTMAPIAVPPIEASRIIGCGLTKMYQAIADGSLPARKSGRKTLILVSDLENWAKNLPRLELGVARKPAPHHVARKNAAAARRLAREGPDEGDSATG
jgi:excisionase family DNA binding protein